MPWPRLLLLPALLMPAAALLTNADEKDPADRVLRLFADEFVTLTPGKGKFPASFAMGSAGAEAPASEKPVVTVKISYPFAVAK